MSLSFKTMALLLRSDNVFHKRAGHPSELGSTPPKHEQFRITTPNAILCIARRILPSLLEDLACFGGGMANCCDVDAFWWFAAQLAWVPSSLVKYVTGSHPL